MRNKPSKRCGVAVSVIKTMQAIGHESRFLHPNLLSMHWFVCLRDTYTLTQYSGLGCLKSEFSHLVEQDSCKTKTAQCSRVYLASSTSGLVPSILWIVGTLFSV